MGSGPSVPSDRPHLGPLPIPGVLITIVREMIHWLTPFCQTPLRKQKLPDCSVITSAVWPASAQDAGSLWVRLMTRPLALDPHPRSPSQALALASATPAPNSMSRQIFGSLQLKNKAKPLFLDHPSILSTA